MRISDWSSDVCSSDLTSTTWPASRNRVDRMRRFLALSRSLHGVLDIAMPGFVALLWLGRFPDWRVLAICLGPALAGYTATYALNDRSERRRVGQEGGRTCRSWGSPST